MYPTLAFFRRVCPHVEKRRDFHLSLDLARRAPANSSNDAQKTSAYQARRRDDRCIGLVARGTSNAGATRSK